MLLLPEAPRTATVAEITRAEKSVSIRFPEKNDAFREIVKAAYYRWDFDARRWRRMINPVMHGTVNDRAIEIACQLLAGRIGVEVSDELQSAIIAGAFIPEHTRWIFVSDHAAFTISWRRPDDLYRAAMRIHGARYSSPNIIVPKEQFNEVLDFAERYDFRLTPKAQELAAQQKARFISAVRVCVAPIKAMEPIRGQIKPGTLIIPERVEVDHDLLD